MISTMAPNVDGVSAPGRRTVYSLCGMCSVRCTIEATVEDGRVVWLQGNPHMKALGASLCAKGAAGLALEYDDDQRPQTPLIRMGARGEGRWRRASWDEALDYIADKLKETIEVFGRRGIALSDRGGPFTDLTQTFVQALGSPNYLTHDAVCGANAHNAARSLFGFGHLELIPDLQRAKHLVLYGRNIVEALMVTEAKAFTAALARGMRCTYIDPRATITACKATRYWQVRPNSDYALNLAIIHEVLKREAYDKDFVARHVSGMEYLRAAVKDTTPEWQESHTGVPAEQLRAFVGEIAADAPHVIFNPGWGTARHKQSSLVSRTALILNVLMGNIEIPGGLLLGKSPKYYGRKGLKRLSARLPKVEEPRVDGAGTTRPQWDPALGMLHQLFAAMETGQPYGIGAYFAYRHDPITGLPDTEAVKRALDKLKLFVSIDVRYSEAGWFADVILPESTYLERANILCQADGPVPIFAMRDQAIAPRFDSRPAWWIFREILRRMDDQGGARLRDDRGDLELPARGHRRHRRRDARGGVRRPGRRAEADAARGSEIPDPLRHDRDRERDPQAGRAGQPAALRAQGGADGRPLRPADRQDGDADARPAPQQPAAQRHRAGTGPLDPPRPCPAAGHRRRRQRRGSRGRGLRGEDQGQRDALDPPRGGVHAARLRRHGAAGHARPRSRRRRPGTAARQALRVRPRRRRLRHDRGRRARQAGG